jgi:hypothetical protein
MGTSMPLASSRWLCRAAALSDVAGYLGISGSSMLAMWDSGASAPSPMVGFAKEASDQQAYPGFLSENVVVVVVVVVLLLSRLL